MSKETKKLNIAEVLYLSNLINQLIEPNLSVQTRLDTAEKKIKECIEKHKEEIEKQNNVTTEIKSDFFKVFTEGELVEMTSAMKLTRGDRKAVYELLKE